MSAILSDILNQPSISKKHLLQFVIQNLDNDDLINSFLSADINKGINKNQFISWKRMCHKILKPISTCGFEQRTDFSELVCLPFSCKLKKLSIAFGINIYSATNRIFSIFFKDPTQNNSFSLYTDQELPIVIGSWAKDVKPMIRSINATGLELVLDTPNISKTKISISPMHTYHQGNTIALPDLIKYLDNLKTIYGKTTKKYSI